MRRTAILLSILLLTTTTAFGANRLQADPDRPAGSGSEFHHFVMTPQRLLNEQEQADLAARGLTIEKPLVGGRYLVRIAPGATVGETDPRIASLTPLTAASKLHATAIRAIASGEAYAHLNVYFHDEVSFEAAKRAIEAAGGTIEEPLLQGFHFGSRIPVVIAASSVVRLASDERVFLVYGARRLRIAPNNDGSAAVSSINLVQTAPYNLSGQGVALSYFELAEAETTHQEFGGRLISHTPFVEKPGDDSYSADHTHATHTGGTMIAAGINPAAKGMAPAATLHEFDARSDSFLDLKKNLPSVSSVADNNSWGYVLGWSQNLNGDWVWNEASDAYGYYDSQVTAPLDQLSRDTGVLMVHSAGNDARSIGPTADPFPHSHADQDAQGNSINISGYCYSPSGNGGDCPAPTCKTGNDKHGDPFCETARHPQITEVLPAPWISIGVTASAKDVIAVGAIDQFKQIARFSSRGPTRDGRVKPDIVAVGVNVLSTVPSNTYDTLSGTSMSAPVVTGASALLVEQWRKTFSGANPTANEIKTLMIATAQDLGNPGPDFTFGFGLLDAKAAVDAIIADGAQQKRIKTGQVATGDQVSLPLTLTSGQNLRVVLGWSDPEITLLPSDPLNAPTLVNDLDLKVTGPGGDVLPYVLDPTTCQAECAPATRGVNHVDNTEEVEIAGAAPGTYTVVVTGTKVTKSSPQPFVLVTNADLGAAVAPCTDVTEPNDTEATAYGPLASSQTITARTCTQSDVDIFKFLVGKPGTVSVTVTATDTPVRVTLTSTATQPVSADVAAGATQTVTTTFNGSTATTFFARVEPTGAIGAQARYTITPVFPSAQQGRRRSVAPH
ncbi:MAG TPA: S8 family serine peptidase [Thermoanaerobaculia bacterium]